MNRRSIAYVCLVALAVSASALAGHAQRSRSRGQVHNMEATADKSGAHSDTFTLTGPALITCVRATSEVPASNPAPACRISASGFNGPMTVNSSATVKPGDINLSCIGQGAFLRCDARVDIPPPGQAATTPPSQ